MSSDLTEEQLAELQDSGAWDWEGAELVRPERGRPHHIWLVLTLDGAAVELLGAGAERAGVTLYDYVLNAALEKARGEVQRTTA